MGRAFTMRMASLMWASRWFFRRMAPVRGQVKYTPGTARWAEPYSLGSCTVLFPRASGFPLSVASARSSFLTWFRMESCDVGPRARGCFCSSWARAAAAAICASLVGPWRGCRAGSWLGFSLGVFSLPSTLLLHNQGPVLYCHGA